MSVFTLPQSSKVAVAACVAMQAYVIYALAARQHSRLWLAVLAFFVGGFLADGLSGLAHFGFDYIWPPQTPIMGPIAVEFRHHHEEPTLDPSAVLTNLTKGAYGAIPVAIITCIVTQVSADTTVSFMTCATLLGLTLWGLGFHQIHSYAHMGSQLSAEEFNRAVVEISQLPDKRQQQAAFAVLFQSVGIPRAVRFLQRCGLFLRPEIHWQHHISFESDFSSVNGWSDPLMNLIYRPLARRKLARRSRQPVASSILPPREA